MSVSPIHAWQVGDRAEWDRWYPGEQGASVCRGTVTAIEGAIIVVKCDSWTTIDEPQRIHTESNLVKLRKL